MGGEEVHGIRCRFGRFCDRAWPDRCHLISGAVRTRRSSASRRHTETLAGTTEQVSLAVSINGQDFSLGLQSRSSAAPAFWMLEGIFPPGGGLEGGIDVVPSRLTARGFTRSASRWRPADSGSSTCERDRPSRWRVCRCRAPPLGIGVGERREPSARAARADAQRPGSIRAAAPQLATFTYTRSRANRADVSHELRDCSEFCLV